MSYTTKCTCDAHQLQLVGCECDNNGPERTVKTFADLEAEPAYEAFFAAEAQRDLDEVAYHEAKRAEYEAGLMSWGDAREDFAECTIEAAKHQ
jgi:hypothetical protein